MPPKTALLVIDMQEFFRSMTGVALPNILNLLKAFSSQSTPLPIIFTQHGHSESELREKPPRNQLVKKWGVGGSLRQGTDDWQMMEELGEFLPTSANVSMNEADKDITFPVLIPKNTYDAFLPPLPPHYPAIPKSQQLEYVLRNSDIERVVVCGVMTDCCVMTTQRGSFNRGFETWVVSDACGSANKKQHTRALECDEFGYGDILTTKVATERLKEDSVLS